MRGLRSDLSVRAIKYRVIRSPFGKIGIVWRNSIHGIKIIRVFLPTPMNMVQRIKNAYPGALADGVSVIQEECSKVKKYLGGSRVEFAVDVLDESCLYAFQKEVLWIERKIPYGRVSTYGRLAAKIKKPGAARAVGTALARNPFPIFIPCHRTIRADGTLGGYQGGIALKRGLLELEGVKCNRLGKVVMEEVW